MRLKPYLPMVVATALVIVVQIGCTWWLTHEGRRNYRANVIETFKACTNMYNPWEKDPWGN
jgi:hypothetical protein